MAAEGLENKQLNTGTIEAFLAARRASGHRRVPTMRTFVSLLDYLRNEGVLDAEDPGQLPTPLDELIGEYGDWLTRRTRCDRVRQTADRLVAQPAACSLRLRRLVARTGGLVTLETSSWSATNGSDLGM
jgi:hypothetical protein